VVFLIEDAFVLNRLKNKVAVITGAAQGIGEAIAIKFSEEGATVVLFDLNIEKMKKLKDTIIKKYNMTVVINQLDVSNKTEVDKQVDMVIKQFGQIDILVNNAGINLFASPLDLDNSSWDKCLSVNLKGSWNCCQSIIPHMINRKIGSIINIASVHGHKVVRGALAYGVSKHGLVGLTRNLGVEYAPFGVRVNSISPGLINTPIADAYFESFEDQDKERLRQIEIIPCKRIGEPVEIANTALFLASDESSFINATDILVDGGRSQVYCD